MNTVTGEEYVIFLPNGCLLTIDRNTVGESTRVVDLKESVFERAASLPLFGTLKQERSFYIFVHVNSLTGQLEEINDETKFVNCIHILALTLKLCERRRDESDRQLSVQIGNIIGKGLHEFDALNDPQVNNCRWRLANLTRYSFARKVDEDSLLSYFHPEKLSPVDVNVKFIRDIFADETFDIKVYTADLSDDVSLRVSFSYSIHQLISEIIDLPPFDRLCDPCNQFILRVAGSVEYFYSDHLLIEYETIQTLLLKRETPLLVLEMRNKITGPLESTRNHFRESLTSNANRSSIAITQDDHLLASDISSPFTCVVSEVNNVNSHNDNCKMVVKAAIFHGHEMISDVVMSSPVRMIDSQKCTFDQTFTFDISVCNLTQVSKLCICVVDVRCKSVLGWVNVTLFDYRNQMRRGSVTLPLSSSYDRPVDATDDEFYCEGITAVAKYNRDETATVTIDFMPQMLEKAIRFSKESFVVPDEVDFDTIPGETETSDGPSDLLHLTSICNSSLAAFNLSSDQKELFRSHRSQCAQYLPDSLPLVLLSVQWNNRRDTEEMFDLLSSWPPIKSSTCLALLNSHFPSVQVKIFALRTLYQLPRSELELLLLPIVQSTRSECFIFSVTVQFLLKLALKDRLFGHKVFTLVKCEMEDEVMSTPFAMMLESYLRFDSDFISSHVKSHEFIRKLNTLSQSISVECDASNESKSESKKKKLKLLSETLESYSWRQLVDGLTCWFDPRIFFSSIDSAKCKVMHSKMKPLCLTLAMSMDSEILTVGKSVIIFKKGDDLRQDTLVLSLIKLCDFVWKKNGYNFHLESYACVPFNRRLGVIEAVQCATTIANIQKGKGSKATSAFRKECLYQWLTSHCADQSDLRDSVNRFTLSCAGYCVISYILGIADRHSDNIMVKTNGQLFHIDFGHILGKFKAKFGIKRERVPFVLTQEFVYVITHGDTDHSALVKFQIHCEEAFILARKHSDLIFNIFNLMLQSGLEEINSPSDIDFLSATLVPELSEQEARKFFRRKFDESLKNGWKTNLNWFAHNLAKDNV